MLINKNTEQINDTVDIDSDEEDDVVYKWLSILLLFIWFITMFIY